MSGDSHLPWVMTGCRVSLARALDFTSSFFHRAWSAFFWLLMCRKPPNKESASDNDDDDSDDDHPAGYIAPQVVTASPSFGSHGGASSLPMSTGPFPVLLPSPMASGGSRVQLLSPSAYNGGLPSAGARSFLDRFLLSVDERR